jgi:hypothetical protein
MVRLGGRYPTGFNLQPLPISPNFATDLGHVRAVDLVEVRLQVDAPLDGGAE